MSAALLAVVLLAPSTHSIQAQVNRIVLRVNDEIATLHDYEKLKNEQLTALAQADLPEARKQEIAATMGEQTMQQLFQEMLLTARAAQIGVAISEDAVDGAVRSAMSSFGVQSLEEFEAGLTQSGMTIAGYREQLRKTMIVREVMGREVQERVDLEEEDLRRYYRSHSEDFRKPRRIELREIVVLDEAGLEDSALEALGEDLLAAIRGGSIDELLSETQGDGRTTGWIELGWVLEGDLDPQLEAAVATLGAGDVTAPARARGGLHILQALNVEESVIQEFQEVRDQIETAERNRLFDQEAETYIDELIDKSYIEAHPPPEAAAFEPRRPTQPTGPTITPVSSEAAEGGP